MDDENDIDDEESDEDEELTEDIEEVTLMEVQDDGEILVILDGRRMQVSPADISTAVLWLPTATLEISEIEEGEIFDLSVVLEGNDQEIRARWESD